jgi:hypothetical protein
LIIQVSAGSGIASLWREGNAVCPVWELDVQLAALKHSVHALFFRGLAGIGATRTALL